MIKSMLKSRKYKTQDVLAYQESMLAGQVSATEIGWGVPKRLMAISPESPGNFME